MRILVDQDEVLCEFTARILEWWNKDNNSNWCIEDIKTYIMEKTLGDRAAYFVKSCMRYPNFFTDLDPVPGAIDGMKKLIEDGHEVVIATRVPQTSGLAYYGKQAWLRKHMPFFDLDNFVAIQKKFLLNGDVLLDDAPSNIEAFKSLNRPIVVFDKPWNRAISCNYRVRSWKEFLDLVDTAKYNGGFK